MSVPAVSVLMPVYNAELYLAEAVESILGQTFEDFEFLIIDDGSSDRSLEILREYEKRNDRIRLVSRPNTGYVVALNELLDMARGELVARMDNDDISMPDRFARQVEYLSEHLDCVVVGCQVEMMDDDGESLMVLDVLTDHESIDAAHLRGLVGAIQSAGVMMRTYEVRAVGGYRDFPMGEGTDLFLRLAERGKLANLKGKLYRYRQRTTSYARSHNEQLKKNLSIILSEAYERRGMETSVDFDPVPKRSTPADHHRRWAKWAMRSGHIRTARKHVMISLKKNPLSRETWRLFLRLCFIRGGNV